MHLATFTEIWLSDPYHPDLMRVWGGTEDTEVAARVAPPPPPGWLCGNLVLLTERFQPNWSSLS
jgi:hypothetical protein